MATLRIPPATPLVPLAEIKTHCRVTFDDDDADLTAYEAAAVSYLDGYRGRLGRCILLQTWSVPARPVISLPFNDARNFVVKQQDENGDWQDVDGVSFSQEGSYLVLHGLPDDQSAAQLFFDAGADTVDEVDASIKQLVKLIAANWYINRSAAIVGGTVEALPIAAEAIIATQCNVMANSV